MIQHKPFILIGPGDTIQEEITARGWSQQYFAEVINMSSKSVNLLINNKQPITLEMASRLSKVFGQSVQFWLNQDAIYREHLDWQFIPKCRKRRGEKMKEERR